MDAVESRHQCSLACSSQTFLERRLEPRTLLDALVRVDPVDPPAEWVFVLTVTNDNDDDDDDNNDDDNDDDTSRPHATK